MDNGEYKADGNPKPPGCNGYRISDLLSGCSHPVLLKQSAGRVVYFVRRFQHNGGTDPHQPHPGQVGRSTQVVRQNSAPGPAADDSSIYLFPEDARWFVGRSQSGRCGQRFCGSPGAGGSLQSRAQQ